MMRLQLHQSARAFLQNAAATRGRAHCWDGWPNELCPKSQHLPLSLSRRQAHPRL
ncbi:MAG: hypothetical protein MUF49_04850 [Oculatellaceae cyanobacterium Prado106]|nr:hypothetical protein [Oculatellaceae cyanobacterium Prado106]